MTIHSMTNNINQENPDVPDRKASKLSITLPRQTIEQMDKARGDVPRSRFVYRSIMEYMSKKKALLVAIPIWFMVMTSTTQWVN
jgi:hypothetical protein